MRERTNVTQGLVSIVMRTLGGRPREIRRAIHSLVANQAPLLELVIVYQGADDEHLRNVNSLVSEFPTMAIRVVHNIGQGDRRAENLNLGWLTARGQYIGFLDDDDTLEDNHVELLLKAIVDTGRAWAYSQVVLRKEDDALETISESCPFRRHSFSLRALWEENFIPIHSFLIDRNRLDGRLQEMPFCEELNRSEDWDFLLRLAFHHQPAVLEEFTAAYYVSTAARNTNLSLTGETGDKERERVNREAWQRCKSIVDGRKADLIKPLWWAQGYFTSEALPLPQVTVAAQSSRRSLHQRVARKIIRILERWL